MAVAISVKKHWTLRELHALPDDGNKYELVHGELFVTPPPSEEHETVAARLSAILTPYVRAHNLGLVYHPRAVMRYQGSEVEPDLMVRIKHPAPVGKDRDWTSAPTPLLVVEIVSPYTRRRDREPKRGLYVEAHVGEYWIVDAEARTITICRSDGSADVVSVRVTWGPAGASAPLSFDTGDIFG